MFLISVCEKLYYVTKTTKHGGNLTKNTPPPKKNYVLQQPEKFLSTFCKTSEWAEFNAVFKKNLQEILNKKSVPSTRPGLESMWPNQRVSTDSQWLWSFLKQISMITAPSPNRDQNRENLNRLLSESATTASRSKWQINASNHNQFNHNLTTGYVMQVQTNSTYTFSTSSICTSVSESE